MDGWSSLAIGFVLACQRAPCIAGTTNGASRLIGIQDKRHRYGLESDNESQLVYDIVPYRRKCSKSFKDVRLGVVNTVMNIRVHKMFVSKTTQLHGVG
jgi:hypothetical protein